MKKLILIAAALLVAAPAFAHDRDDDDDDDYRRYNYNEDYAPPPEEGPTFDEFRSDSDLSWNGEWIDTPEYGTVWRPTRVSDDWQPYVYGRWAWTTVGWAWVSEEPFGWAVYHYGRWAFAPGGWVWIPGRVWAPAWVEWRWGNGYASWCPLGPRRAAWAQPWVSVPARHFLEPVRHFVVPVRQALPAPFRSAPAPHAGPPPMAVERATGHTLRPLSVSDAPAPHAAQVTGGSVGFYRPHPVQVARPDARQVPRAAPPRPGVSYGAPVVRQNGPSRPAPSNGAQTIPHARER